MAKTPETLKRESKEQNFAELTKRREEALNALRRLRKIGERLPPVDAAAIVREGRNLAEQGTR